MEDVYRSTEDCARMKELGILFLPAIGLPQTSVPQQSDLQTKPEFTFQRLITKQKTANARYRGQEKPYATPNRHISPLGRAMLFKNNTGLVYVWPDSQASTKGLLISN